MASTAGTTAKKAATSTAPARAAKAAGETKAGPLTAKGSVNEAHSGIVVDIAGAGIGGHEATVRLSDPVDQTWPLRWDGDSVAWTYEGLFRHGIVTLGDDEVHFDIDLPDGVDPLLAVGGQPAADPPQAVDDRLVIDRDDDGKYRWQRYTSSDALVAQGQRHDTRRAAEAEALHVNPDMSIEADDEGGKQP